MDKPNLVYLYCFPLDITRKIKTSAGLRCFLLIWLKCCYAHNFSNILITKKDRERIQLSRLSYLRGLEHLEKNGIITVDRKAGRACRISINVDLLDKKSKDFILKQKEATA